jgi:predicted RND superfamily exporter protein/outer membrane lipoprotein-sorting protein
MKLLKGFEKIILDQKHKKTVQVFYRTSLVFLSVIFFVCLLQITKLKSEYNVKQFFPKSHPLLTEEQQIKSTFKLQEKSSLVLLLSQKNAKTWLSQNSYSDLKKFTTSLQKLASVKNVFSLAQLQGSFENKGDLVIGSLFDQTPQSKWQDIVTSQPMIKPFLLSENQNQTLVAVELVSNDAAIIDQAKSQIFSLQKKSFQNLNLQIGGIPSLQSDVAALLKNELMRSAIFGFLFFIFVLFIVFKNYSGVLITLINLVFVNTLCLALLSVFKVPMDVLLSTLPVLISLSVLSMTVQILIRHSQNSKNNSVVDILNTLTGLFTENALVGLTTLVGFLMLSTSEILIIKKYGLVISSLIFISWATTQVVLVPLLLAFPKPELRSWFTKKAYWSLLIFKYKNLILVFSAVAICISMFSFFKLNWSAKLFDDLPTNNISRITTERIDNQFGGTLPLSVVIHGTEKMWSDPRWIAQLNLLTEKIRNLKSVGSALSAADILKKQTGQSYRLPASSQEAAESLFLFSMAESDPSLRFLNQQSHQARIDLRFKDFSSSKIFYDEQQIKNLVTAYFPLQKFELSGMATSVHKMNQEMSKDLIFGFWQSILAIALFLILVFRSLRWTIVACLPNLIPPLFLIFVLAATQTPIKPGIAIIFSIAIGLAFTNTVYVLMQLKKLTKNNLSYLPIKKTMLIEMIPCFLSTLLSTSAFMIFLFSYFEMNKLFGAYMIVSLVAGAFGDLIFLPALLAAFPQLLLSKNKFSKPATQLAVFILTIFVATNGIAAEKALSVDEILNRSKKLIASQDDSADVVMKIIEADGTSKERSLSIQIKKTKLNNSTVVKINKPLDLKGTGLLSQIENGSEQQWIYLPSTKQTRRVVGANKKGTVLGSELSPQDLDFSTIKSAKATLLKTMNFKNHNYALIEIKSAKNDTDYAKAIVLISLETYLPMRLEYYDAKNVVLKRVEFDQYQNFGGVQRAQSIKIKNLVNKRGTDLTLSKIKSNTGLSDEVFSQRALSKD